MIFFCTVVFLFRPVGNFAHEKNIALHYMYDTWILTIGVK